MIKRKPVWFELHNRIYQSTAEWRHSFGPRQHLFYTKAPAWLRRVALNTERLYEL